MSIGDSFLVLGFSSPCSCFCFAWNEILILLVKSLVLGTVFLSSFLLFWSALCIHEHNHGNNLSCSSLRLLVYYARPLNVRAQTIGEGLVQRGERALQLFRSLPVSGRLVGPALVQHKSSSPTPAQDLANYSFTYTEPTSQRISWMSQSYL